jgi:long-chain acyl-CoA synthetase
MSLEGRAVARLAKVLELALVEVDLSPSQYRMLLLLADGSAGASALASRLDVSPPSVTALIDGLVARGLVGRRPGIADRRKVEHQLTAKGRALLDDADQAAAARLAEVAAYAPAGRAGSALSALTDWSEAMSAYRDARMAR